VLAAIPRLDVRLQAVPKAAQERSHGGGVNLVPHLPQPLRQMTHTLEGPTQK